MPGEENRSDIIRTVAGCIVAIIAAAYAWQTGDRIGWLVGLLMAGIIEPQMVVRWLRGRSG